MGTGGDCGRCDAREPIQESRGLFVFRSRSRVPDIIIVALAYQSDLGHEASQRADGEGSAAETEKEEVVARLVVIDQKAVEFADVGLDPSSERAAVVTVKTRVRAYAFVIVDDLAGAVDG